ncbi:unnamed protein product, partial [Choristocarpus tenellus]
DYQWPQVVGRGKWRKAVENAASFVSDNKTVKWFPRYGCAVLAIGQASPSDVVVKRRVIVVGLNEWTFGVHSSKTSR